jgi:hypothetical protein
MSAERCDKTELLVTECAHCKYGDARPEPIEVPGHVFAAWYPGVCTECEQEIHPGDWIVAVGLDQGYAHDGCVPR